MNMKSIRIACVAALLALAGGNTLAAEGDVLVRLRALHIAPDASTNNTLSALDVGVKQSTVPELDLTYMFTDHIGAELILGVTRHRVTSNAGSLGKVSLLPPTLTLQYHFNPDGQFRPYVGAGINYTRFYDNSLSAGGQRVRIDRDSFGPALQLGMDIGLDDDWFMNVDVKKLWIRTDASLAGASLGTLKIDPWLVGVGIGRRF
ncbi:outer membrane protein [Bordetella ansorpii]|uniref:Outer membrane protein n=1 Tax=Bordetella ansorpii TaxID=288768 RepID=A0A157S7Q8_9BORD|nr:OmpW family outer membrane protein [Bordetella ansorpii]SAI66447.1 outer membrane protein [Bordetella ansorpii]